VALWALGFVIEALADWQLFRFGRDPANRGQVLRTGLWAWSRHPNYFGEALVWWGFGLLAVSVGGWWTLYSPLVITLLLLKVSGVALMEKDIGDKRPDYRHYIETTSAFVPMPPRRPKNPAWGSAS
jgi:steroid 5-alpha reductase family enzyme